MKKFYLIALSILMIFALAGCSSTENEAQQISVSEQTPEVAAEAVVQEVEEPAPVEPAVEDGPVVIDEQLPIAPSDPTLEQKFSYTYGHILAQGLLEQELLIDIDPFLLGSTTFFNGEEPIFDDEQINAAFEEYQALLDEVITVEDFEAVNDSGYSFRYQFSYGYGYIIQFNLQSQGIIVSLSDFNSGVSDAFAEIPLQYDEQEIDEIFNAYVEKLNAEYEDALSAIAEENLAAAESFLEENGAKEGIMTTDSGLQYEVISLGDGEIPTIEDTVKVDYQITFLDGTTGDSSYARGEPSVFPLANLIPGFIEGVQLMPVGSHFKFYIHPSLAYQETGNEMIPPNTLLIFDVELHEIVEMTAL